MVSETLKKSRLLNGEAEVSFQKHGDQLPCQILNGRFGNPGFDGNSARPCVNDNCGEDNTARASYRDASSSVNIEIQPDILRKKARKQKEMTFQDMYNNQDIFDEDDEDDSDWEPLQKPREIMKWFCTNCSMANLDVAVHCNSCGEHRESGIVKHGFFASPFLQDSSLTKAEPEAKKTNKGMASQVSPSNSSTVIGFDERMLLHSEVEMKSHPHPERPDRLRAIAVSLATAGIFPGRCYPIPAREITKEELAMVHSLEHIEAVELTNNVISCYFTPDTYANKHSAQAARLAAGLCADLASEVVSGRAKNGFALVRPPGHHAGVRQAMGFCLHNNAAVSALAAQAAGAKKVLIVDWDVHHGNGTQEIFEQNKSVLYISLHRHEVGRFYPGTGAADEVGTMGAEGYCVNVPWSQSGVGDNDYMFAFQQVVLPIASEFTPDLTIISAGFDAARGDPLGMCDVTPAGYAQMTHLLNIVSGGKLLVILEGGYNLRAISSSATAVIKVLLGESPSDLVDRVPSRAGMRTVFEVLKIQKNFWPMLESSLLKLQSQRGMHSTERTSLSLEKFKNASDLANAPQYRESVISKQALIEVGLWIPPTIMPSNSIPSGMKIRKRSKIPSLVTSGNIGPPRLAKKPRISSKDSPIVDLTIPVAEAIDLGRQAEQGVLEAQKSTEPSNISSRSPGQLLDIDSGIKVQSGSSAPGRLSDMKLPPFNEMLDLVGFHHLPDSATAAVDSLFTPTARRDALNNLSRLMDPGKINVGPIYGHEDGRDTLDAIRLRALLGVQAAAEAVKQLEHDASRIQRLEARDKLFVRRLFQAWKLHKETKAKSKKIEVNSRPFKMPPPPQRPVLRRPRKVVGGLRKSHWQLECRFPCSKAG